MTTDETPEQRLARWSDWLEEDLFQQIHELARQREVFKSWNEIVDVASPESKRRGLFHTWPTDHCRHFAPPIRPQVAATHQAISASRPVPIP